MKRIALIPYAEVSSPTPHYTRLPDTVFLTLNESVREDKPEGEYLYNDDIYPEYSNFYIEIKKLLEKYFSGDGEYITDLAFAFTEDSVKSVKRWLHISSVYDRQGGVIQYIQLLGGIDFLTTDTSTEEITTCGRNVSMPNSNRAETTIKFFGFYGDNNIGILTDNSTNGYILYDNKANFYVGGGQLTPWGQSTLYMYEGTKSEYRDEFFDVLSIPIQDTEPSTDGGGAGTGHFSGIGDTKYIGDIINVPTPVTPSLSPWLNRYVPTDAQLTALRSWLWSNDFVDLIVKAYSSPMDAITGLMSLPFNVPRTSASHRLSIGNLQSPEGVTAHKLNAENVVIDCGSLRIDEIWGSALDYAPYTKISIMLPYIGERQLSTDDVMGKTLKIAYTVDCTTGDFVCFVLINDSVLCSYDGNCAYQIPITAASYNNILSATLNAVQGVGTGIAIGGAAGAVAGAVSIANNVYAAKPRIERSGRLSGVHGHLGTQKPYIIREIPRQSLASDYNTFVGYPSNITAKLSTLSGYTEVESIHIENMTATAAEREQIENLLKSGVII